MSFTTSPRGVFPILPHEAAKLAQELYESVQHIVRIDGKPVSVDLVPETFFPTTMVRFPVRLPHEGPALGDYSKGVMGTHKGIIECLQNRRKWIKENCEGKACIKADKAYFQLETDAIHFYMVWGG